MLQTPTRSKFERAAHRWDAEAYAELLRYDARFQGHTARWFVRGEAFGWQIVVDGWFYLNPRATKKDAKKAYEEALENGDLGRQLTNWAQAIEIGQFPFWWEQDHHLKGRLPTNTPNRVHNVV